MKRAISSMIAIAIVASIIWFLNGIRVPFSQRKLIAHCTTNDLRFFITVEHYAPYALVLGVPSGSKGVLSFGGQVTLTQATGTVARILIGSDRVIPCNWLDQQPNLTGYILTWPATNGVEHFSELLRRGQTYDVQVMFSNMPPDGSSLWFTSIQPLGLWKR